jgi:hypothetical protein
LLVPSRENRPVQLLEIGNSVGVGHVDDASNGRWPTATDSTRRVAPLMPSRFCGLRRVGRGRYSSRPRRWRGSGTAHRYASIAVTVTSPRRWYWASPALKHMS